MSNSISVNLYPASVNNNSPVRAYAEISLFDDSIYVCGIKILDKNGTQFVVWPEYRIGEKRYHPVKIKNADLLAEIKSVILNKYNSNDFSPPKPRMQTTTTK